MTATAASAQTPWIVDDGDGRYTIDEMTANVHQRFSNYDADQNGGLSANEIAAQGYDPNRWALMDRNGDGEIDREEWEIRVLLATSKFYECDVNQDDSLDARSSRVSHNDAVGKGGLA